MWSSACAPRAGKVLYVRAPRNLGRIIDPRYVAMMNTMMRETLRSGTAHSAQLPGWQAAGKTGTSQDFRDAWFVGYTGHLVAGVWLGNDDSSPTKKATGGGLPVEAGCRFMKRGAPGRAGRGAAGLVRSVDRGDLRAGADPGRRWPDPVGECRRSGSAGQCRGAGRAGAFASAKPRRLVFGQAVRAAVNHGTHAVSPHAAS